MMSSVEDTALGKRRLDSGSDLVINYVTLGKSCHSGPQ